MVLEAMLFECVVVVMVVRQPLPAIVALVLISGDEHREGGGSSPALALLLTVVQGQTGTPKGAVSSADKARPKHEPP